MSTNYIYPCRVEYRFGGHKNSLKYFLDDLLRYGGLKRIQISSHNNATPELALRTFLIQNMTALSLSKVKLKGWNMRRLWSTLYTS